MFIKYEAEVSSRVGGGERGVVDFGMLFTETNEQKFSFSADKLDLLLFATRPVVENMLSSTKISSRYLLVKADRNVKKFGGGHILRRIYG